MSAFETIQVVTGPNASQIYSSSERGLITNTDLVNNVWLSDVESFNPGSSSNSIILRPLASFVSDGSTEVWAVTLPGVSVAIEKAPGLAFAPSPIDIASAISLSGISLLSASSSLVNFGSTAIGAGLTDTVGTFSITQIGYELSITVGSANAASTGPFIRLLLQWTDTITNTIVAEDKWFLAASTGTGQIYMGTGPTKGNQLKITLVNEDPAFPITCSLSMAQNGRVYVRDDIRQQNNQSVPGFTNGNVSQASNYLIAESLSIASNAAQSRIIPLYAGMVSLYVAGPLAFDVSIVAFNGDVSPPPASNIIWEGHVTAAGGGFLTQEFALPRCTCIITLTNNGAASQTINASLILAEQQA